MKVINTNMFPRDGYFFRESDGAKIVGQSWKAVMYKVRAYRARAGLPAGNVEAEVAAQACSRNPAHCSETSDVNTQQLKVSSLKGRVLQYLSFLRRLGKGIPWVDSHTAAARANVCAGCPQNTALAESCGSCRAALRAMRDEILGRNRAKDARLNGCAILGEDLQVSCHVDHDVVDEPTLPGCCWRRRSPPA